MKSIRNIKIKTKLLLLGAISILGLLFIGTESVITASKINQASTVISQSWVPAIIIAEELNTKTSDYRLKEYNHVITTNWENKSQLEKEMADLRTEMEQSFTRYENYTADESDRKLMAQAKEYWKEYIQCSDSLLLISRENDSAEAFQIIMGESSKLYNRARSGLLKVVDYNRKGSEAASIGADHLYERLARMKVISVGVVGFLISLLVIYIIIAIDKPVKDLVEGTRRMADGDLDVYLSYRSMDEIGILTNSVNELIDRLKRIIDDEKYLFQEIGSENFEVKSTCEKAYRGDFAPILYSITSLMNRLSAAKKRKEEPQKNGLIENKGIREIKGIRKLREMKVSKGRAAEVCVVKEIKKDGSRKMDASDEKS
ncbi:MCP four helix bundle domain-containing protein [Clostridium boliviensis]|uniref:MCP four helix bundle domain-containing protein n=1 Tax=Clostridium boliviensis TaxID=318465 RepID=A0ABU4GKV4_9CLOT|nr:MCP four helix bundle domain-containing protein [Clostridium boliviensis]MDW2798246.1 MCP four helix bundle domain-containing protein [Clostridium boliviensis]